jgi:DNA repair exonuclease SbcCD nuclease subunit
MKAKTQKTRPIAVLISDVHYNLTTLELADAAMRQAITKANSLNIPLIVAGDLHDSKANMRAECVNRMIETFKLCNEAYVLVGNHDKINEKSNKDDHSLNFLDKPEYRVNVVAFNWQILEGIWLVPYYHDPEECKEFLKTMPKGSTLIMHQGLSGTNSGEYIQDKSAIRPEDVAGMRVISGHYHTRQTIELPDGGKWDYIGNPYTLNYAEASDPAKGFQIIYDDGSLEFISTKLRKHTVLNTSVDELKAGSLSLFEGSPEDLVWVKISGTKEKLKSIHKQQISGLLGIQNFRLDLIPTAAEEQERPAKALTQHELLDTLIDQQNASEELKTRLKQVWRGL